MIERSPVPVNLFVNPYAYAHPPDGHLHPVDPNPRVGDKGKVFFHPLVNGPHTAFESPALAFWKSYMKTLMAHARQATASNLDE